MASTPLSIANRALAQIGGGDVPQIAAFSDGSAAADALLVLYTPAVQAALREVRPTFARRRLALSTSGNPAPGLWSFEYLLPADCLSFLNVIPLSPSPLDPKPNRWEFGTASVGGSQTTVVWSNLSGAIGFFVSGIVQGVLTTDGGFQGNDPLFEETIVRFLKSALAEAIAGRFDQAKEALGQHFSIAQICDLRADA